MSAAKPTSDEAVAKALDTGTEMTGAEIVTAAAAGRVRQVSDKPRRYSSATAASSKGRRSRRAKS